MRTLADIGQGGSDALDVERLLESYALETRIVASEVFVRSIQLRLAQEPPLTPWRRAWHLVRGLTRTALGREQVTAAVRLQALALLILGVLALGMAVGGAGAVVVSLVRNAGETEHGPQRPNDAFPLATGQVTTPDPSAPLSSTKTSSAPGPLNAGSSRGAGDAVQQRALRRHPTHAGSAASGGQPTRPPKPTPSPPATPQQRTATPSDEGGESPPSTIAASQASTVAPTVVPTVVPTADATKEPSASPEQTPEGSATADSSAPPTASPLGEPVPDPTPEPTIAPSVGPTAGPSPPPG